VQIVRASQPTRNREESEILMTELIWMIRYSNPNPSFGFPSRAIKEEEQTRTDVVGPARVDWLRATDRTPLARHHARDVDDEKQ
jgi:hypothetical protein